jgi:hypothetical protein
MIIDLETLFPEDLSDEAVGAIAALLNDLAMQWESRYFHRIRDYQARQQLDLFDPGAPWRRKTQD